MDTPKRITNRIKKEVLERRFGSARIIDDSCEGIERIVREELNATQLKTVPKKNLRKEDSEPRLIEGDIYLYKGNYFIGGIDSPTIVSQRSGLGAALEFLLRDIDKKIAEDDISRVAGWKSAHSGMYDLMNRINSTSLYFKIVKTCPNPLPRLRPSKEVKYALKRKNIFAKEGINPDFRVISTYGDISAGEENFYVGSSERGIYGKKDSGEGRVLGFLLKNQGIWIGTIRLYEIACDGEISPILYNLKRKINGYSSQFIINDRSTEIMLTANNKRNILK